MLLQFTVLDPFNTAASSQQILQRFFGLVASEPLQDDDDIDGLSRVDTGNDFDEDDDNDQDIQEADEGKTMEQSEKRKKKNRLARLKRRTKLRAYQFSGQSAVAGVLFLEIQKITDLPPEKNSTRQAIRLQSIQADVCSDPHLLRHGPFRGHFSRPKDISYACRKTQSQSRI